MAAGCGQCSVFSPVADDISVLLSELDAVGRKGVNYREFFDKRYMVINKIWMWLLSQEKSPVTYSFLGPDGGHAEGNLWRLLRGDTSIKGIDGNLLDGKTCFGNVDFLYCHNPPYLRKIVLLGVRKQGELEHFLSLTHLELESYLDCSFILILTATGDLSYQLAVKAFQKHRLDINSVYYVEFGPRQEHSASKDVLKAMLYLMHLSENRKVLEHPYKNMKPAKR